MRILGISGSLRATSSNAAILRAAARVRLPGLLPNGGIEMDVYDGLPDLPAFSPDLDTDPAPKPVRDLRARIAAADGLMICSPEYAHGVPGSLKNLLDWLVSALEALHKPVLLLSASPGGAVHAHAQLLEVLRTMNLRVVDARAHVFSQSKLDASGEAVSPVLFGAITEGLIALAARITEPIDVPTG